MVGGGAAVVVTVLAARRGLRRGRVSLEARRGVLIHATVGGAARRWLLGEPLVFGGGGVGTVAVHDRWLGWCRKRLSGQQPIAVLARSIQAREECRQDKGCSSLSV